MSKNVHSMYMQAHREVQRQWKFDVSVVNAVNSSGSVNTTSAGRASSKDGVNNVYPCKLNVGDSLVHLGSQFNDIPMGFGRSPWTCG